MGNASMLWLLNQKQIPRRAEALLGMTKLEGGIIAARLKARPFKT
jgi:hypothetical protein